MDDKSKKEHSKAKEQVLYSLASFVGMNDSIIGASKTVLPTIKNLDKTKKKKVEKKLKEVPDGFIKPLFSEKIDTKLTNSKVFKHVEDSYPLNRE